MRWTGDGLQVSSVALSSSSPSFRFSADLPCWSVLVQWVTVLVLAVAADGGGGC